MPLRDHFRPPVSTMASWEGFQGQWPAVIVQQLRKHLPTGYVAGPLVHSGSQIEVDIATFRQDTSSTIDLSSRNGGTATATAVWAPAEPSVSVETTLPEMDEYEVRIYDATRGRRLVAAIELISPANKDRPEHRNVFVAKCAALIQKDIAVSLVDVVTVRHLNLYTELLEFLGHVDPTLGQSPPELYAASIRWVNRDKRTILETWSYP